MFEGKKGGGEDIFPAFEVIENCITLFYRYCLSWAGFRSFLAAAGSSAVGSGHGHSLVILQFKDLRAYVRANSAADTGLGIDFHLHLKPPLYESVSILPRIRLSTSADD
jgi:hypothetical protein